MKNNADMIKLVRLVEGQQFAGQAVGQKPGDQVRGTDKAVPKGNQHPFKGRLVGEEKALEDVLAKKYADFKDLQAKDKEKKKEESKEELDEAEVSLHIPGSDKMSNDERHQAIMAKHPDAKRVGKTPGRYRTKDGDLVSGIRGVRKLVKQGVSEVNGKELDEAVVTESLRLVGNKSNGDRNVKIYKDLEWSEYVVQLFVNGEHQVDADYHTDDKMDALDTAHMMLKDRAVTEEGPEAQENPTDNITVDVPLMLRIMEFAREDAQDDMALHDVTERLTKLTAERGTLTMADYDEIVGEGRPSPEGEVDEAAPWPVRAGVGLAAGVIGGAGGNILGAMFGPLGSAILGGYSAWNSAKLGMQGADDIWDWAAEKLGGEKQADAFGMAHAKAAAQGQPQFKFGGSTFKTQLKPDQAGAAAQELKKVGESRLVEFGAEGSALGAAAQAKSAKVATAVGNTAPTGNTTSSSSSTTSSGSTTAPLSSPSPSTTPGQQASAGEMDPEEQDALDKIKTNAGLKSQYDRLIQQAKAS